MKTEIANYLNAKIDEIKEVRDFQCFNGGSAWLVVFHSKKARFVSKKVVAMELKVGDRVLRGSYSNNRRVLVGVIQRVDDKVAWVKWEASHVTKIAIKSLKLATDEAIAKTQAKREQQKQRLIAQRKEWLRATVSNLPDGEWIRWGMIIGANYSDIPTLLEWGIVEVDPSSDGTTIRKVA